MRRLGLTAGFTAAELTTRFRRLARLLHPDKNQHPRTAAAFDAVQQAYKQLNVGRPQ